MANDKSFCSCPFLAWYKLPFSEFSAGVTPFALLGGSPHSWKQASVAGLDPLDSNNQQSAQRTALRLKLWMLLGKVYKLNLLNQLLWEKKCWILCHTFPFWYLNMKTKFLFFLLALW